MPVKLIPQLRFLSPSLTPVCHHSMKFGTSVPSSRVSLIFSQVFPFKLRYFGLSNCPSRNDQVRVRRFSTRSFRPRQDSRSGSAFDRGNERERSQSSKSLVEDEADLSDWVTELRKDSIRGPTTREGDSREDRGRSRSSFSDRDSSSMKRREIGTEGSFRGPNTREGYSQDRGRSRSSFSDRDSSSMKRRERDTEGSFRGPNTRKGEYAGDRGGLRSSFRDRDSFSTKRRERDTEGSFRGPNTRDSSDEDRGRSRSRFGDRDSFSTKRRERDIEKIGYSSQRRTPSPVDSYSKSTQGFRRNVGNFRDNSGEIDSRRKNFGSRGKSESSLVGRRGEVELSFDSRQTRPRDTFRKVERNTDVRQVAGGQNFQKSEKGSRQQVHLVKSDEDDEEDEEDEEDFTGSFGDLLSEGDSEDEDSPDDDESDGYLKKKSSSSLFEADKDGDIEDEDSPDDDESDGRLMKTSSSFLSESDKEVSGEHSTITKSLPGKYESYLSDTRFDQCSISPLSLKGIKDVGYEKMTVVQEATLPVILKGKDVLAKAKTGTGKTVAFLLPSIEVVVNSAPMDCDQKRPPIIVLVICPTRELASQAFAEANTLLKYHPSIGVQVVIGGTRLALEQKRLQANPCQILVATPGRLRDHTENTAGFATKLMGVKVLVLDEADHLLDMGFRKDIEKIIASVPKQRQTLLFSATVPEEVRQICHIALKRDHEFINTVEEGSEETHSQVRQSHLIAPLNKHFPLLYTILKEHIADDVDYKVLVFCTTAMVTRMVANLLSELNLNVREIHSRKAQSYRTKVSDEFRKSKGLILVTSDVSARGVDYPDVTLVIQVGLPADREQYIHRLGRTGRKGKEGEGILLLAPWEEFFLLSIKDLPLSKAIEPLLDPETKKKVERSLSQVEMKNKEAAYQAWLGYYNSNKKIGKDKCKLVELANEFSHSMGLDNPPAIPKLVLGKMGLKNIPGLRSK